MRCIDSRLDAVGSGVVAGGGQLRPSLLQELNAETRRRIDASHSLGPSIAEQVKEENMKEEQAAKREALRERNNNAKELLKAVQVRSALPGLAT